MRKSIFYIIFAVILTHANFAKVLRGVEKGRPKGTFCLLAEQVMMTCSASTELGQKILKSSQKCSPSLVEGREHVVQDLSSYLREMTVIISMKTKGNSIDISFN